MRVVVPRGAGRVLRRRRFEQIVEVDIGEEIQIGNIAVRATYADHEGGRGLAGRKIPALGYVIRGSRLIYFAGDTDLFEEMPRSHAAWISRWCRSGVGVRLSALATSIRAAEALRLLRPRLAVPIHWGTYYPLQPGRSRPAFLTESVDEFRRYAAELAPSVELHVLPMGGSVEI